MQIASQRHPHIWFKDIPINRILFDEKDLTGVLYANGDIFKANEDGEEVMVDTVKKEDNTIFINLVSIDRVFNGVPIEYKVSEQMLSKYFTRTPRVHPFIGEGNYSVTVGD